MSNNPSKPRKNAGESLQNNGSPLPIPIASSTGIPASAGCWASFKGVLKYKSVMIEDTNQAETLWRNGFFGQGNLSSGGMSYDTNCDVMNMSRYNRRKSWKEMSGTFNHKRREDSIEETENFVFVNEDGYETGPPVYTEYEDPFPLREQSILTLEEALFLSYALGTLVISSESGVQMDIDQMWRNFIRINPCFPLQYAVYHHFRCKGWVVKPGMKFGADWLLYKLGPPFYHAKYLVWVQCVWKDTLEIDESLSTRNYTETDLSALERLASHVAKEVLLCHVVRPRHLTEAKLGDVACLRDFEMSEATLRRWKPQEEEKRLDQAPLLVGTEEVGDPLLFEAGLEPGSGPPNC